ncbi:MAG: putative transporter [Bacteroidales bacterium]|jgi:putative transport protein|nr:putative transporter [Bacteroidales bacterium]
MEWIKGMFLTQNVAQSILLLSITIALGIWLGRIKIKGISLGITWILFVGIVLSHFGLIANKDIISFAKDFGLILFVYAIGLQVGPGFFESLKKGGLSLNLLATLIVVLGCVTAWIISIVTGESLKNMVGVLCGAVTNTPSLGAAGQTLKDSGLEDTLPLGYAVAYPLGVIGIIFTPMIVRAILRINVKKEEQAYKQGEQANTEKISIQITKENIDNHSVGEIVKQYQQSLVITRIRKCDGIIEHVHNDTKVHLNDVLRVVALKEEKENIIDFLGKEIETNENEWDVDNGRLVSKRIVVTNKELQGKKVGDLHIDNLYDVTLTTVNRAGVDLLCDRNIQLQMGDRVVVVGSEDKIKKVADMLGNSLKKLDIPNLVPIFLGIFLGIVVGLIPFKFPGIPQPVKLGLAGGPLIIAILIARYGPYYKVVTFTTTGANMMIREIGISLFLAAVGLSCGKEFVSTVVNGGYWWVLYGFIITVIPLLLVGMIARIFFHLPYFSICGLIAGSTTDPPALAFANASTETSLPATAYATVYPLSMFLRILSAQILIIMSL